MRLTAVKLAGFKSFVDPTTFLAPSNLTGIVGPNGCGKSNIIDAVRWVMGEGSAKVLRGESMADVIFSGSSSRKPVGTATVELIFDNSDGRVGGEYAGYNEISVKRQVSRDGFSNYYLNGTRCRRKDITDLFLGTGLGPRSYSIIEQGMISQIVEARPEEIRGHLEEAAGISKYKERRRETENRIRHTRENLERLSDLREEVGKHLAKLKRQAKAAERYKKYKQQARELDGQLMAYRWQGLQEQAAERQQRLKQLETGLEAEIAKQRESEAKLESLRNDQAAANEQFTEVQGELYQVGGEIARLEQAIQHERELQARQRQEHEETEAGLKDLEQHIVLDRAQVEDLSQSLAELEPALAQARQAESLASDTLEETDLKVQDWQSRFEAHHREAGEQSRQADVEKTRIDHLDQRIGDSLKRVQQLKDSQQGTDDASLAKTLAASEKQRDKLQAELEQQQSSFDRLREKQQQDRSELEQLDNQQRELSRAQNTVEGRLESLKALQQAALGEADDGIQNWIGTQGLDRARRLAESLEVDPAWRSAVELVLGHWLEALVVEQPQQHATAAGDLTQGQIMLLDGGTAGVTARKGSLAEQVTAPDRVIERLNAVHCAADIESATQQLDRLGSEETVITPRAEWLGHGWLRVARGADDQAGVLAREEEIRSLEQELERSVQQNAELGSRCDAVRERLTDGDQQYEELQSEITRLNRRHAEAASQVEHHKSRHADLQRRHRQAEDELGQLQQQLDQDQQSVKKARGLLETVIGAMAGLQTGSEALDQERKQVLQARDEHRAALRTAQEQRHDLALKVESKTASLDSLRQSVSRMDNQLNQLQTRFVDLSQQLAKAEAPEDIHRNAMDKLLETRVDIERRLADARSRVQSLENDYRETDAQRQKAVQAADAVRQDLERARLSLQEVQLKSRTLGERLAEVNLDISQLASELDPEVDVAAWEDELATLQQRIERLEPVNLAAIQEYDEEYERKAYLDQQNEDLMEALATLERAIEKIDRKTRTRFKETFERVNKGIEELFPRLFGGGHAYLELTGEDLLTTGVSIMARPPGKRVSSIHLLSGGEKALTAVSFVFAIFRLNPAPFCLLDEVDAPLDDANVGRFSAMVSEMSDNVQFVIVTHNKITMEMANQLCGVTMREPGVSRLVSVDIDQAAMMAAS